MKALKSEKTFFSPKKEDNYVLKNINLSIPKNETKNPHSIK